MADFSIVKKGYDKNEVDRFIFDMHSRNEDVLREQRDRIDLLKKENEKLKNIINGFKERENCVSEALLSAVNKAKEVEESVKVKFAMECERIRVFQTKWTGYVEKAKAEIEPPESARTLNSALESIKKELFKRMENDLNIKESKFSAVKEESVTGEPLTQYKQEYKRLDNVLELNDEAFSKLKSALGELEKETACSGGSFNIEEALAPKESLEELCRSLGLID